MWKFELYAKLFQLKLSNYDKHPWEHGAEQRILQGIDQHSTRDGKTRSGLIDVDVIRGSVFAKAKPGHGWMSAVRWGLLRVAFAPFYWNYWRSHTSFRVAVYIMIHFFLQFLQVVFFLLTDPRTSNSSQDDLLLPCLLAICLGILHAHITAPHGKTGLYSSFIDNPMTNQSFKDIGEHSLNPNCYQYNTDNLLNNKFGSVQTVINKHAEYDHSSWFPVQSSTFEQRKFPTNIYSENHQSNNASNPNNENTSNTSEQCTHSSYDCFECCKTPHLANTTYAKDQRNIHWRSGEMKPKRPLTSCHKFSKTHLDSGNHDDCSNLYGPGDNTQHEVNVSDVTYGTDGVQTPCTLDEECERTKLLHNSQVLEHRSRVVRRRRRQNSYNSKHGNSSRGHDADVEESEGELLTVSTKKDVGEIGFNDQTVNSPNPDFIPQLQLRRDLNPDSAILHKRKQVSESALSFLNVHAPAKLSKNLGGFPANTESPYKVGILKTQSTSDPPIPLKTDQFIEPECLPPHLSHISSLSSSFDSLIGTSHRSLKRSLSMSFLIHRKNTTTYMFPNDNLLLKKSFSDALLNLSMGLDSSQYHLFDKELPLRQKRNFRLNYNNMNNPAREVLKLRSSNQQNHLNSENTSFRKISLSSHSSAAAESSTNSAQSFSSMRKFQKGNRRIFELESVHDIGAELTANPKCGQSSVDKHLDKKTCSSYTNLFECQLIEDMKSAVKPVELSKEFQKLNELNEERDLQLDNYDCPEFKNKSYEYINKDNTITMFNRQRAKYLRLFLQRASHLQHPRVVINPTQTDTDMLESDSAAILDNKLSNVNLKYSNKYISTSKNPDINFKPCNQRLSLLNSTNKSCLKSTSPKVFYDWSEANCMPGSISDRSPTTSPTATIDLTNSQDAVNHASQRNMKQYIDPNNGFVRDIYSHSHYFSKNESQYANMNARGQTASETEYFDRINSDLGSDVDSSSCPDEVESPSQPSRENELQNWQHSNPILDVTVDTANKPQALNKDQVSRRFDYRSRISKHYCPKCSSRLNIFLSTTTDSGRMNSFNDLKCVDNDGHQKPTESHEVYESPQSIKTTMKNECLSSAHENALLSMDFEVKEKKLDSPVTKENIRSIHIKSHLTRDSDVHNNLLSAKTDTVRCYMWAGQKLSKFNLSMLDIGKNVIYAVERQSISSDYIIFACIATFVLPFISVIFHSANLSNVLLDDDNSINNGSCDSNTNTTNQYQSLFITTEGTVLFFGNNNSSNQTFNTNNAVFGNTIIGLYLNAILSLFSHLLSAVAIKMHNILIDTNLQTSRCSQSYCIVFWNIVTGQFLIDWFTKPDIQGRLVIFIGFILRFNVYGTVFFLLCIAERTFQERLLYAKYFFSLTSGRRALKYRVPQFRLNKVGHIKCWLMLRSYLKKRGPQRSVEHIMTTAFYIVFTLGLSLCAQLLSKSRTSVFTHLTNWDILGLSFGIIVFLYRFILLGTKITKKYRNFSVLITEQINLYLSMESKPHKKEDLMLTFQVLRLVEGLLKEVDGPFRVCGWTLNPLVYNIFKLVLLSCVSTLLSESLGFKLKLYKLKLNPSNW
ncbi:unnamed protein product [Schistosoma turkestanicum]|nr:unnamed protein product [Schistosoma turkestanicum]